VSGQPPLDLDAVARLANAVRSRHCEPGGDRQSYNLAQAALRLLGRVEAMERVVDAAKAWREARARAEPYPALAANQALAAAVDALPPREEPRADG
jgi:hypothetical protein